MQLRSPISCSAAQSLTPHKAGKNEIQSRLLQVGGKPRCWFAELFARESLSESWCEHRCENLHENIARKVGYENSATKCSEKFSRLCSAYILLPWVEIPPSTAGNSMAGSGRPSPEPLLKKRRPQPYWGGEHSGNALEASNALNCRVWAIPAVLSKGIPGNALRAFPGSFRSFRNFFWQVPAVLGVWAKLRNERCKPKSEMLGLSQPGRALRQFRASMSAYASKPAKFLCVNLWCQGCFQNLFVKVYQWMQKTEPIMVVFAEDNASNRLRKN